MSKTLRRLLIGAVTLAALFVLLEQRSPFESRSDERIFLTLGEDTERTVGYSDERFRAVALGRSEAEGRALLGQPLRKPRAGVKLMVLYPHPTDVEQFDNDYRDHLKLLHEKANIPEDARPYTVTKFLPTPEGPAPFYQLFTMPFPSLEALQQARSSFLQEVAADAVRISSGGAPVVLIGSEE